jgi:P pilus assembly chaperone PapD
MKHIRLMTLFSFALFSTTAWSEITVRPMSLYFKAGGSPYKDVLVSNKSKTPTYVDIQAVELLNPGTPAEKIRAEKNPKTLGLLVTPIRSKLNAKQARSMRVSILQAPGEKERDYRLWVRPLPNNVKAKGAKPASPQMYLQVLTAYYVYVHVLPENPAPQLQVKQSGKAITVKNTGNVVVELRNGKQCNVKNQCEIFPKKTLYPNAVWQLAGKTTSPAKFDVYIGPRFLETIVASSH